MKKPERKPSPGSMLQEQTAPENVLRNRKRERFCRLFAGEYWGDATGALRAAYPELPEFDTETFLTTLLQSAPIRRRIEYLREVRSSAGIADDTWIRESLARLAQTASRESDRIRALSTLDRMKARKEKKGTRLGPEMDTPPLPLLFEGEGESDEPEPCDGAMPSTDSSGNNSVFPPVQK